MSWSIFFSLRCFSIFCIAWAEFVLKSENLACRARPISFQETLDRLRKQDLDEGRLNSDTERWKQILEHRAAETAAESGGGGQGHQSKMLWDVIIEASEEPPKPIKPKEIHPFVEFMSKVQDGVRRAVYQVVENSNFSLFVAGNHRNLTIAGITIYPAVDL